MSQLLLLLRMQALKHLYDIRRAQSHLVPSALLLLLLNDILMMMVMMVMRGYIVVICRVVCGMVVCDTNHCLLVL